jgi:hypothetical protein
MNKEKYLGEAFLKDDPKKKLNFTLRDGCVTTEKLADGAVTSDKIADGAIDLSKVKIDLDSLAKLNKDNTFVDSKQTYTTADNANTIAALDYESLKFSNKTGAVSTLFGEDCGTYVSIGKDDSDVDGNLNVYTIADSYYNRIYFNDGGITTEFVTEASGISAVMKPGLFTAVGDTTGAEDSEVSMSPEEIHIYDGKHINQFTVTPTKINWVNVSNKHEFGLTHDGYYDSNYTVKDVPSAQKTYIHIGSSDDNTAYTNIAPLNSEGKVPNDYIDDTNIRTIIQNTRGYWPGYGYSDEKPFITVDESSEGHSTELVYFNSNTVYGSEFIFDKHAILYSTEGLAFGTAGLEEKAIDYNTAPIRYTRNGVNITGKTSKDLVHAAGTSNGSTIHVGTDADTTEYKYVAPLNDEGKVPVEYLPESEDKFHIETATDGFYIIDSNKNIGLQYNEEGLDAALVTDHFKELISSENIDEAPNDGNTYGRKNKSWVKVDGSSSATNSTKELWLGTLCLGDINTSNSAITSSSSYVVMKSSVVLPYLGVTLNFSLPSTITCNVFYNSGTKDMDTVWTSYSNNTMSDSISNGGSWTAPINHVTGYDAYFYRIRFSSSDTISLSSIQSMINSGKIKITYTVPDNDSVVERNQDVLPAVNAAAYNFINNGTEAGEYQRAQNNIPCFIHTSDLHGDVYRLRNALSYADYISADAAILSGDFCANNGNDDATWLADEVMKHTTPSLPCVGNHDSWDYTYSQFYNVLNPIATAFDFTLNSQCYYYKDFSAKNIRVISLNQYYTTSGSWQSTMSFGSTQFNWLVSTLNSTPTGYGVIINIHYIQHPSEAEGYSTFYDYVNDTDTPTAPVQSLLSIIDGFISKNSGSVSVTDYTGTFTVSYDFTSVDSTTEFIAYCYGHQHIDTISYASGTTNKQLCLGISTNNIGGKYAINVPKNGGIGKSQDLFNVYGIDRTNGKVRVVRVGTNTTVDMKERKMMVIPYK